MKIWVLAWPASAFLLAAAAALAVRAVLLSVERRVARAGSTLSAFLDAVRFPSILWCLVFGLYVAFEVADLPPRLTRQLGVALEVAVIFSVTMTISGLVGTLIARATDRALGVRVTGLAQTAARVAVVAVGLLILLDAVGLQITPILTALGVGGLAVALGLQDTLANLFAGIHLLADRPIRVGDYVKLSEGVEGFVIDVGWRSTRLRMLQNNVVVVPNLKVAQSIITNYDMPEPAMALLLNVAVSYAHDADLVEAVIQDEAMKAVGVVPGLLAAPPPFVRLIPGFGEYSLNFTLICQVATFVDQYQVQHELRKRLLRRFRREGIQIPYPVRTVEVRGDRVREGGDARERGPEEQGPAS